MEVFWLEAHSSRLLIFLTNWFFIVDEPRSFHTIYSIERYNRIHSIEVQVIRWFPNNNVHPTKAFISIDQKMNERFCFNDSDFILLKSVWGQFITITTFCIRLERIERWWSFNKFTFIQLFSLQNLFWAIHSSSWNNQRQQWYYISFMLVFNFFTGENVLFCKF